MRLRNVLLALLLILILAAAAVPTSAEEPLPGYDDCKSVDPGPASATVCAPGAVACPAAAFWIGVGEMGSAGASICGAGGWLAPAGQRAGCSVALEVGSRTSCGITVGPCDSCGAEIRVPPLEEADPRELPRGVTIRGP